MIPSNHSKLPKPKERKKIPLTQTMLTTTPPLNPCSFSFTTSHHHHLTISKRLNLLTVSANWVRKKKDRYKHIFPHNYDTDIEEEEIQEEGEVGGIGHVMMKSLKSDIPPPTIDAIQNKPKPTSHNSTKNSNEEEEEEEEKGKIELNGMDVLMALQRAKSQTRSKPRRRKQKGRLVMKRSGHGKEDGDDDDDSIMDYRDVKPLNVKSDWGTRLDECEKCLQQLLLHQKF